jgi:glycosyltransferase involved in cell wall biosynthesis
LCRQPFQDINNKMVDAQPAVLVVAGMHRSGTSFVASLLHRSGCRMGEARLPADAHNRPGYFEDLEFLDLNRRMLAATVPADRPGHADWGWTEDMDASGIDAGRLDSFVAEADALVTRRRVRTASVEPTGGAAHGCWGWKDPRTSVLLDFWDTRLPDARYVFVYRSPWDVADSMQRLGAAVFLRHPEFAYRVWYHYNRALLAFARLHRDRTLIVNASAVVCAPQQLLDLVRSRFDIGLAPDEVADVADPTLLMSGGAGVATLSAAVHPECVDLLREMAAIADLPSGEPLPPSLAAPPRAEDAQVAIVIPCFNHGEFLLEAIASVERSVSVPYELVIVNDGSRDRHTLEVLACLRRAGYRIVDQDNRGLAEARNRGIREANRGTFLPLDADNRLRPGFVEAALDVLARDRSVMAVYGDRREYGLRSGRVQVGVPDLNRLLCGNYIDACAVIRLEAWRACGGYDPEMPVQGTEDWDLWLSMLERGFTLHRLDMETFDYRVRPESMLSETADPEVQAAIERYVLAKHAPFYLQHLRRQVDRLDILETTLAETEAQLTALRRTSSSSEARPSGHSSLQPEGCDHCQADDSVERAIACLQAADARIGESLGQSLKRPAQVNGVEDGEHCEGTGESVLESQEQQKGMGQREERQAGGEGAALAEDDRIGPDGVPHVAVVVPDLLGQVTGGEGHGEEGGGKEAATV